MKNLFILAVSLLAVGSPPTSQAQAPREGFATKITEARKANAALMKKYSWHSRTELIEKEKTLDTRIELVSYGPDGQLVRSLLNDQGAELPRGFLRRRLAEKQKEKVEKYLGGLRKLLDQYTLPTAGKVLDFVEQAKIQAPDAAGLLQLTGSSVVVPGDTFSLSVEAATRRTRAFTITTTFEGDEVNASASFKTLPSGLTYVAFAEVDVAAKEMKLQLQNFDFNQSN